MCLVGKDLLYLMIVHSKWNLGFLTGFDDNICSHPNHYYNLYVPYHFSFYIYSCFWKIVDNFDSTFGCAWKNDLLEISTVSWKLDFSILFCSILFRRKAEVFAAYCGRSPLKEYTRLPGHWFNDLVQHLSLEGKLGVFHFNKERGGMSDGMPLQDKLWKIPIPIWVPPDTRTVGRLVAILWRDIVETSSGVRSLQVSSATCQQPYTWYSEIDCSQLDLKVKCSATWQKEIDCSFMKDPEP